MKKLKISILGLGNIGSQLTKYIQSNIQQITSTYQVSLDIGKVYVKNLTKSREIDLSNIHLSDNPYEVIEDADIVIECMGGNGVDLTKELILRSIKSKKTVIMSSKKCLALHGKEITDAVKEHNTIFHYDATVGGGIPISSVFETMGKCETIEKIYGICNGTSNYILDEMKQKQISYDAALNKAIMKGYAENDPSDDVDGYDALYKSVIMIGFGMNQWIDPHTITPHTIATLTHSDILEAKRSHGVIKPVFYVEKKLNSVHCYIGPKIIRNNTLLSIVRKNNNMIVVYGSESHERAFYGQGAGKQPTASAMYDDLIKTIKSLLSLNQKHSIDSR